MANLPFFRSPFYNPYYNRYYNPNMSEKQFVSSDIKNQENLKKTSSCNNNANTENSNQNSSQTEKSSRYYSFGPINFKSPFFNDIEEPIFEILGIQLYLDDIIILGLLFFLYQEKVKDEMLYISLILLLLS